MATGLSSLSPVYTQITTGLLRISVVKAMVSGVLFGLVSHLTDTWRAYTRAKEMTPLIQLSDVETTFTSHFQRLPFNFIPVGDANSPQTACVKTKQSCISGLAVPLLTSACGLGTVWLLLSIHAHHTYPVRNVFLSYSLQNGARG